MAEALPVLIAGAGIGGLTLACALRRHGVPCRVVERTPVLRPVGAGITMQGNAMLAFRSIGLEAAVRATGAAPREMAIYRADGRLLTRIDVTEVERRVGAPTVAMHRGDLHAALASAAGDVVMLGAKAEGYDDRGDAVTLRLADGRELRGRAVIGADGLHSAIRTQLLGETPLRYAGYTSWRGVTAPGAASALPHQHPAGEALGRGERFGWIPVGGDRVYWFAVVNAPEGETEADPRAAIRARFAGWKVPAAALIEATTDVLRTDIHDRAPVERWGTGRVALLGDAAHPMTPNLGQGGCQAVEDAVVLGQLLATELPVTEALRHYQALRVRRANRVVGQARRLGRLFQADGAVSSRVRNVVLRAGSGGPALRQAVALMLDGLVLDARAP